jgi:hypothetical protein
MLDFSLAPAYETLSVIEIRRKAGQAKLEIGWGSVSEQGREQVWVSL